MKIFLNNKHFFRKGLIFLFGLFFTVTAFSQGTITGTVIDEEGVALPGVTVLVKGTLIGTVTGADGSYSINANSDAVLVFSFVGYATQEFLVGDQRIINTTMLEDVAQIEEIVVVGYGVMRKSDVTGAVLSVSEAKLKDRPVTNAMEALQGKAAGVDITNNVRPGELGNIRIRGERSITGSSDPLYVVDGIPMFGRNNVNSINTQDIKSIDILKDASATAIYGSRGANGVVLITTISGEEGRYTVNYNGSVGFSKIMDSADRLSAVDWVETVRWGRYYADPVGNPRGDQPNIDKDQLYFSNDSYALRNVMNGWVNGNWVPSNVKTTDWTKFITQNASTQNHTLSVSGGTAKVRNYASFGYMDQKGNLLGQRFKRYTVNVNTTTKPFEWFEVGARLNGSFSDQDYGLDTGQSGGSNSGAGSIYDAAIRIYPHAVPYDDNGNRIEMPGNDNRRRTIVGEGDLTDNRREMVNIMANAYAQIKLPLEGLSYRVEFGPSFRYRTNGVLALEGSVTRDGSSGNYVRLDNQRDFVWTVNNIINYNKFFDVHSINVTLLQTASKTVETGSSIQGEGDTHIPAKWNVFNSGMINAGMIKNVSSTIAEDQLASYMARINYGFNNRYLATVSGRMDGSSRLAPGHKWSFFPSASLAWRMEQEDFIKSIPAINQLKLRLGWGVTGNAAVDRYATKGAITQRYLPSGTVTEPVYFAYDRFWIDSAADDIQLPNLDLGWEKTAQWNLGIDFSILNSRVSGVLEFYRSNTTDLLLSSPIPSQTGYLRTTANIGETKNQGVELTLNTVNIRTQSGFTWETDLNVAWQKNEIVRLSNGTEDEITTSATGTRLIGKPISIYYNLKATGIWKEEDQAEIDKFNNSPKAHKFAPGLTRIQDQNGDYEIDETFDRVYIGKRNPTWTGGMTNTFSFKGVELMISMYGRFDYWTDGNAINHNAFWITRKVDYYTEANKNGKFQRPQYESIGGNPDTFSGANNYTKASYLNIRNISLAYNFPTNMINGWGGMQSLRIYAQCINPGSIYSACDFKNMDVNSEFWYRTFTFGVNVGF